MWSVMWSRGWLRDLQLPGLASAPCFGRSGWRHHAFLGAGCTSCATLQCLWDTRQHAQHTSYVCKFGMVDHLSKLLCASLACNIFGKLPAQTPSMRCIPALRVVGAVQSSVGIAQIWSTPGPFWLGVLGC